MAAYTGSPPLPALLAGDIPPAGDWSVILSALHAATDAWIPWTSTLSNLTLGNGSVVTAFRQLGKVVDYRFKFTLGSTSAVGTGPSFSLPVQPHAFYVAFIDPIGEAQLRDDPITARLATVFSAGGNVAQIIGYTTTGTQQGVTATVPHTWGVNDVLSCSGRYEAA